MVLEDVCASRKGGFLDLILCKANVKISDTGTIFAAMVLKLCKRYLIHITDMYENFFSILGPELWGRKDVFKSGTGHFFCGNTNLRICYMGTVFETMILKLCTGYLVCITDYVCKGFFRFLPFLPELWGKRDVFKSRT